MAAQPQVKLWKLAPEAVFHLFPSWGAHEAAHDAPHFLASRPAGGTDVAA